ncbi:HNH/ENDO VII family nuclease [Methylomicrobium album]|nr:HNH/ENDO VII family nuclease [Methylomicrobium album]
MSSDSAFQTSFGGTRQSRFRLTGLAKGTKATSQIDRAAFKKERESFWKNEAKSNTSSYSASDLERMEKGKAPIGSDGHPMELHHKDRTMNRGLEPMTRTDHRLGGNYRKNHLDIGD